MKILIHSNSPRLKTGYGVQTGLLATRLRDAGHDVAISAFVGQYGTATWNGITVYPGGADQVGNDVLPKHALHHFGGDPKGGWIITLLDVFVLNPEPLRDFNVAAWCPVDHAPVPPAVRMFFDRSGAVPIAMSRFGESALRDVGLDPLYVPLAIDPADYHPTDTFGGHRFREIFNIADDAFVVSMNAMNKTQHTFHRKGFPQAFAAFGEFSRNHPEAVLYLHTEATGRFHGGDDLLVLARECGIAESQLRFVDQYAYQLGDLPAEYLAAAYTASDLYLAPSMGEGFCVPLIEAQACGTPVLVSDFSAQPELVGDGWTVGGTPWWDGNQQAWVFNPIIDDIAVALETAFDRKASGRRRGKQAALAKAAEYDIDRVFTEHWLPALVELDGPGPVELDRAPMPDRDAVAVLVPVLNRPQNVAPLVESFNAHASGAHLYFVCDQDDEDEIRAVKDAGANVLISDRGSTWAQKINSGFDQTLEPWILCVGDDVRFHPGWLDAARPLSDRFDVIGTNDHEAGEGNPRVAAGVHSDHCFVRRAYVDLYGGCLGAGPVFHEGYRHFFSDVELVELAKARRVFTPCLDSLVEHLHPDLGKAEVDDTYRAGWSAKDDDAKRWAEREPLVAMQREGRGR